MSCLYHFKPHSVHVFNLLETCTLVIYYVIQTEHAWILSDMAALQKTVYTNWGTFDMHLYTCDVSVFMALFFSNLYRI